MQLIVDIELIHTKAKEVLRAQGDPDLVIYRTFLTLWDGKPPQKRQQNSYNGYSRQISSNVLFKLPCQINSINCILEQKYWEYQIKVWHLVYV